MATSEHSLLGPTAHVLREAFNLLEPQKQLKAIER